MKSLILVLLLPALAACERQAPVVPDLPAPALTGRVVDEADLLTPTQEAELTGKLAAVEREVGPQYVIVTLRSLHGYPIEDYGYRLGRKWGIGSKARNDGVMLIVAPVERKVRIEVGYGLERRVTDPFAGKVIREQAVPRFKSGQYPEGIEAVSDAVIARLRSKATDAEIARADGVVI